MSLGVVNGVAGVERMINMRTNRPGTCLMVVSQALGTYTLTSDHPGAYGWALKVWNLAPESVKRHGDKNIPKGGVGFLSPSGNGYGHIFLGWGDGRVVSTDSPTGHINFTTIDAMCSAWGRHYLGWMPWMMGRDVSVGAAPSGHSTPNLPAASAPGALLRRHWNGVQMFLKHDNFGYNGRIDDAPGPQTVGAFQNFLNRKGYAQRSPVGRALHVDHDFGGNTLLGTQQWLKETGRYHDRVDGEVGSHTISAWDQAEHENFEKYRRYFGM
jgi:hypothetical protein